MLRLITFGGLTLLRENEPVSGALSQRSRLALLAVLAVSGRTGISRDALVALFWPDSDAEHARRALNQNIYGTRRYLGSDDVILGTTELRLHPSLGSDVADFEAAVEAGDWARVAALHVGPFLDGIYLRGSGSFERWSASRRDVYQAQYVKAIERLVHDARSRDDHSAAADWLRRLASLDVLNTRHATELMRALADSRDYRAAISHFRLHEAALQQELGVAPDTSTVTLREEIEMRMKAAGPPPANNSNGQRILALPARAAANPPRAEQPAPAVEHQPRKRQSWILVSLAAGVLIVLGGVHAVRSTQESDQPRVLVTPFENATGDPALDVFGNLIADWTVARLGDVEWAKVALAPYQLGPTSNPAKHATHNERALASAKANDIEFAVTGSFSRAGDTLVIQPVILDSEENGVLQRVPEVRTASGDLSRAAEEVRQAVAGTLASILDRRVAALRSRVDRAPRYDAYSQYIVGLERFHASDFPGAYAAFTQARSTDTSFVLPLIWQLYLPAQDTIVEDSLLAVLAERREKLTPLERAVYDHFEARSRWDFPGVQRTAERTSKLAPGSNWSLDRAVLLVQANRLEEALQAFATVDVDGWVGTSFVYWVWYARAAHLAGEDDLALRIIADARRRNVGPEPVGARTLARPEAAVYAARGDRVALNQLMNRLSADPAAVAWVLLFLVQELHWHRHFELKKEMQARLLELTRTTVDTTTPQGLATLTTAYATAGMNRETWQTALRLRNARPIDIPTLGRLGIASARLGNRDVAQAYSDSIKTLFDTPRRGVRMEATLWRARIAAALGRKAEAVELLRQSAAQGQPQVFDHLAVFEEIEDYEPFWELRKPVTISRLAKLKQALRGR